MATIVEKHKCDICGGLYSNAPDAMTCEAQGIVDFKKGEATAVGDLVFCHPDYGWHDATKGNIWYLRAECKAGESTKSGYWYRFIWIVTARSLHDHEARYHLLCPIWAHGNPRHAWTGPRHFRPVPVHPTLPNRQAMLEWWRINSGQWLGVETDFLL